jgi:hypothetical protein
MRARVFLTVLFAILIAPGVAAAKGADAATITGAGLATPISVSGNHGPPDIIPRLAEQSGFYPGVFAEQPDPMLTAAPPGDLGPRLDVAWHVPTGEATADVVHQDIYPYADGGPVTYVAPGQPFFETQFTHGGWYRSPSTLTATLTQLGVPSREELEVAARPATPPSSAVTSDDGSPLTAMFVAVAVVLIGGAMVASIGLAARRRRRAVAV